ncbi:hypothetical protein JW960_07990 [candidate division KSB1 bacterium]|nr:hypothetical protein [candidate division KSB1 bacterium]
MNPSVTYFRRFPVDFTRAIGEDFTEYEFNSKHVPMVRYYRSPDYQHNPVAVSQFALHHYNEFIDHQSEQSRQLFLNQSEWLLNNAHEWPHDALVWWYPFDIPYYGITKPWISGMAQGEALAVLVRAHQLTGNDAYLQTAERAFNVFQYQTNDNGVLAHFNNGNVVIEEYPSQTPSCVLNGFLFALLGIQDYITYCNRQVAATLFDECIDSLHSNLAAYDAGYWSFYEMRTPLRLASLSYHRLHILQLRALGQIADDAWLLATARKWESYLKSPICRLRWAFSKTIFKIIHEKKLAHQLFKKKFIVAVNQKSGEENESIN